MRNLNEGAESQPRIVGGEPLSPDNPGSRSALAIVYASRAGEEKTACSAVLVAPTQALTAAHCLRYDRGYFPFEPVSVHFVPGEPEAPVPRMRIVGMKIHSGHTGRPRYAGNVQLQDNDLALLELEGPVPQGRGPVKMLPPEASVRAELAGRRLVLVGFGHTNPADEGSIGKAFSIVSTVREHLGRQFVVVGQSEGRVQDTCEGDSGGPAYIFWEGEWHLLGLLSTGTSGCYGTWSSYTDASAFRPEDLVPFP